MKNDLEEIKSILLAKKEDTIVLQNYEYIIYDLKKRAISGLDLSNTYAIDKSVSNSVYDLLISNGIPTTLGSEFVCENKAKRLLKITLSKVL